MSAQPQGQQPTGPPSYSSTLTASNQLDKTRMTDSMIVNDRSRMHGDEVAECVPVPVPGGEPAALVMAGPMLNSDPLFLVSIIIGFIGTILAAIGVFLPNWFIVVSSTTAASGSFPLMKSKGCPSKSEVTKLWTKASAEVGVCHGKDASPFALGSWVLAMQILALAGLAMSILNLLLQLVNLCLRPRRYFLHMASMYVMGIGCLLLMLAGHIGHHYAVWQEVFRNKGSDFTLQINSLGPGLFHLATVIAAWVCVLTHVSSHAPGPLSVHTRFAHQYDKEEPVQSDEMMKLEQILLITDDEPLSYGRVSDLTGDDRKASIHSTEV
ncbi:uncharacterized protein [Littorina saxatilis]|uniref:Transmembrane protein n=1 Tax=Littorina saxatilis TaxID=31220 RepID=A0AAN9B5U5_9CAEN